MDAPFRRQRRSTDPTMAQQWHMVCQQAWQLQRRWYRERGYYQPTTMRDPPPGDYQQGYFDDVEHDPELVEFRNRYRDDIGPD